MKVLIVVLALVALSYGDGTWHAKTKEELKTLRAECAQEHPMPADVAASVKRFEYTDTPEVRQYVLCIAEKTGIFCPDEGYHSDRVAQQFNAGLPVEEVKQIATNCFDKNEQGSPVDVWAYRGHNCFVNSKVGDRMREIIKQRHASH